MFQWHKILPKILSEPKRDVRIGLLKMVTKTNKMETMKILLEKNTSRW